MLVFNEIQNAALFTNGPQLALSDAVHERLTKEQLATANDLVS